MSDVTRILSAIDQGNSQAAEQLLPLLYDELRRLATVKMAQEKPGQTLQATALVHEAYLRLVDGDKTSHWENRRHFFAAAAEAMRCILIENARRKGRRKRGGDLRRVDLDPDQLFSAAPPAEDLLDLNDALDDLAAEDSQAAQFVKLQYFTGLSIEEAAEMAGLGIGVGGGIDVESWPYGAAGVQSATVTITGTTLTDNQAVGGLGGAGAVGGDGMGGGCSDASSVTINGSSLDRNQAQGGAGGQGANGGNGEGGGVVVLCGSRAALSNSSVTQNSAIGGKAGAGGSDGSGCGGGLYIDGGAVVTATNTKMKKNTASAAGNDIYGTLS
jgi:RNA polymerase sigma factor (TIGR02999 family)